MLQYIVIVGAAINFVGTFFYLRRTIQGITKPNRVTFFIWALAPMIAFGAALSDGVGWAALPVFVSGFLPLLIFLASFWNPHAYWKLGVFDYVCGGLSILALVLWWQSNNPSVAILLAILSDGLAGWPTMVKAWRFPETEYWSGYAGGLVNAATALIATNSFTFTAVAFPIYLILACTIVLAGIFRKKLFP